MTRGVESKLSKRRFTDKISRVSLRHINVIACPGARRLFFLGLDGSSIIVIFSVVTSVLWDMCNCHTIIFSVLAGTRINSSDILQDGSSGHF